MTWVRIRRLVYLPVLAVLLSLGVLAVFFFRTQPVYLLVIAGVLFLPGVIAQGLLKDLFASRVLLARGDFEGGLAAARRFLAACGERPWLRHAIWGAFGIYSLDVIAIAQNNAGAALLELKRFHESERFLLAARNRDPAYPLPFVNLAIIERLRGANDASNALAKDAYELGMRSGRLEGIHRRIGETYARLSATPKDVPV